MGIFSGKLYPKSKVFRVKENDFKRNKNPERLITEGQYATVSSVSIPDHPFFSIGWFLILFTQRMVKIFPLLQIQNSSNLNSTNITLNSCFSHSAKTTPKQDIVSNGLVVT